MEDSPFSRLPLELREQIIGYVLQTDNKTSDDCVEWRVRAYSYEPAQSLLLWLARRNAVLATCHELQSLGVRVHLRRQEYVWKCSLLPPSAWAETMNRNKVIFWSLPSLQSRGYINSIGGVGAITTDDYLHRERWDVNDGPHATRYSNWGDNPLELFAIYKEAAYIAFKLRQQQLDRGLEHRQLFMRHSYRLQPLTDGNAFRPVKKALRGTWKRDTMELTIDMLDEATSIRRMETGMALLHVEHREKIAAIRNEIDRQKSLPYRERSKDFDEEEPFFIGYLCEMDMKYGSWWQRVKRFHEGLIKVAMLGYRMDYRDVDDHLDEVKAGLSQNISQDYLGGSLVVDAIADMVNAIKPYEIDCDHWAEAPTS
ncbi:hypothetical protein D6D01_00406 [Aureobasidium pullulans]|uniref:Uncharacterized protein n=1 Tax=Aureobasidium pullulans TaxID=5580 RepID=A0A4S9M213_AURPU|nr:hypothetical protein D6D01_00406 [Aureobasidium pullulans]